ncbi:hypothetical protein BpHYR1_004759 [Brachionus plicatilis]|uniref:Uncharacterized protein n=1 Tax=Brachionus plicatilis TaxID=10195 RepID=A0A3M7RRA3_BRAPC|nr:hypothetical protein BpHYR1_004759 [Brachionus plicatilis]
MKIVTYGTSLLSSSFRKKEEISYNQWNRMIQSCPNMTYLSLNSKSRFETPYDTQCWRDLLLQRSLISSIKSNLIPNEIKGHFWELKIDRNGKHRYN